MSDIARVASAADISTRILAPVMDAQVANRQQQRLLDAPETAEADSVLECMAVAAQVLEMGMTLARTVALSNRVEKELEQAVAGYSDEITTTMRNVELNRGGGAPSGRKLAADLAVLVNDPSPWALAELAPIFQQTPESRLFSEPVTYQLGKTKTARLRELHGEWKARHEGRAA